MRLQSEHSFLWLQNLDLAGETILLQLTNPAHHTESVASGLHILASIMQTVWAMPRASGLSNDFIDLTSYTKSAALAQHFQPESFKVACTQVEEVQASCAQGSNTCPA